MSDIHGAVGSYVVHALDADEQVEFEEHLGSCELCRREVAELSETVAELSALSAVAPPPAVRASVLNAIKEVRPLPPETGFVEEPEPDGEPEAPVHDELALRRARRRARVLSLAVAAAMVVALALGGWAYGLVQQQQAQVAAERLEAELLAAPDAKLFVTQLQNGGRGSFVVSKSLNRAVFIGGDLPDPGPNKRYQLWTLQGVTATPDNLLDGGVGQRQVFRGPVGESSGLAVTIEPSAGSQIPTLPIQASVEL